MANRETDVIVENPRSAAGPALLRRRSVAVAVCALWFILPYAVGHLFAPANRLAVDWAVQSSVVLVVVLLLFPFVLRYLIWVEYCPPKTAPKWALVSLRAVDLLAAFGLGFVCGVVAMYAVE